MKQKLSKQLTLSFCLLNSVFISLAQTKDSNPDKKKESKIKILPVAYYMPETRLGLGALVYKVFRINDSDTVSRNSNIQSYLSYTINKQFLFENEWLIFTKNEKFNFSGALDYTRFPEFFFGIGNSTSVCMKELYSFDMVRFKSKNIKHLGNNFFTGFQYDLQYLFNVKKEGAVMMNDVATVGSEGYLVSGIGPLIMFDRRDNILNTTKGAYTEVLFSLNNKIILSDFDYNSLILDFRQYKTLFNRYTLAVQTYGNFNFGNVPFRAMPVIGGAKYLRGYYKGRFKDNNLLIFQAEMRIHLFGRFGTVLFSGIGQVSDKISTFETDAFKLNYGTGLRYKLNKKDNVNLRLDVGFTNEGYGLYVVFAEAF